MKIKISRVQNGILVEKEVKCSCGCENFVTGTFKVMEDQGTFGDVEEIISYAECSECFEMKMFRTGYIEERK